MTAPKMVTCEECAGEGGFEDGPRCGGRCDWCGGCYDDVMCEACQGVGEVEDDEEELDELERLDEMAGARGA